MNLNYAIFRSEPIMTMSDLRQIGSHNNREKLFFNSNPDIKLELSKDNIELIPIITTYTKELKKITRYYDNKDFNSDVVYDISRGTDKEDELFDNGRIYFER